MEFKNFKDAVSKQFAKMATGELYTVAAEKPERDSLWDVYLSSFPQGSDPLYKVRTEHDCNCCKQFIRAIGPAVAIVDGQMVSVWDVTIPNEPEYQVVADALAVAVKQMAIKNVFVHGEAVVGQEKTFYETLDGKTDFWHHFHVRLPNKFVISRHDIASHLGNKRTKFSVLKRALDELKLEEVETVLELIAQNSLYRGQEHTFVLNELRKLLISYNAIPDENQRVLKVWSLLGTVPDAVIHVRNSSIGELVQNLSDGEDLETAVKKFEAMVAPANYRRPTALVTKGMIEKARKEIEALGLTSALQRRYANIDDITVNNVLFVSRATQAKMTGDVFDELAVKPKDMSKKMDKIETVSIEKFIADILPTAESIELMVENKFAGNFVSLIAPDDATAKPLFKWSNNFSWSYNGDVTDAIKERVKNAGGSVEGYLCCRLAWDYTDDLDFHMYEPTGSHISYASRHSTGGGQLDVDANGMDGIRADPVENIFYANNSRMKEGRYELMVHNFNRRSNGAGFTVQIESEGQLTTFEYSKVLWDRATLHIADIVYSYKNGITVEGKIPSVAASRKIWNVATQDFHKVNAVMLSPNYWDDNAIGNKHYFFMLEGCTNDGQARGLYNEFLLNELNVHRKVLEMVGNKLKTAVSDRQLSGLGFSSTVRAEVLCRVKGKFARMIKIAF